MTLQLRNLIVQGQLPISDIMQFNANYSHADVESRFEQLRSMSMHKYFLPKEKPLKVTQTQSVGVVVRLFADIVRL